MGERFELSFNRSWRGKFGSIHATFDGALHMAHWLRNFNGSEWVIIRQTDKVIIAWSKAWETDEKTWNVMKGI